MGKSIYSLRRRRQAPSPYSRVLSSRPAAATQVHTTLYLHPSFSVSHTLSPCWKRCKSSLSTLHTTHFRHLLLILSPLPRHRHYHHRRPCLTRPLLQTYFPPHAPYQSPQAPSSLQHLPPIAKPRLHSSTAVEPPHTTL